MIGVDAGPTANQSNGLFINNAESDAPMIGGDFSTGNVTFSGTLRFTERGDHILSPTATFGELWVRTATPNELIFTDDAGTDHDLTAGGGTPDEVSDADGDKKIQVEEGADDDIIRFDTGSNITGFPAKANALLFSSGQFTLALPQANVAATDGGAIALTSGPGQTTGDGGDITFTTGYGGNVNGGVAGTISLVGGVGGASGGHGGDIDLTAGNGIAGDSPGGVITLSSGDGNGGNAGGDIALACGDGGVNGLGGNVVISAGVGGATSGAGGAVTISSGAANGTNDVGGAISLTSGAGIGTGVGGALNITAGDSGSGATGAGGAVNIESGAAVSTNDSGGDITVTAGAGNGSGTDGIINLVGAVVNPIVTLADSATPSVGAANTFLTGGTTTLTDLTDGTPGQHVYILSEHAITITDGTNIFLDGSANFVMASTDSLHLVQKADGNWYEISRTVS